MNKEELEKILETNNAYALSLFRQLDLNNGTNIEEFYNDVYKYMGIGNIFYCFCLSNAVAGYKAARNRFDNFETEKINRFYDIFVSNDFSENKPDALTEEEVKSLKRYREQIEFDKERAKTNKDFAVGRFKNISINNENHSNEFKNRLLENKDKIRNLTIKYKDFCKEFSDLVEEAKTKIDYLHERINFYKTTSDEYKEKFSEIFKELSSSYDEYIYYYQLNYSIIVFNRFITNLDTVDENIKTAKKIVDDYKENRDAFENEVKKYNEQFPMLDQIAKEVLPKVKTFSDEEKYEEARNLLMTEYKKLINVSVEDRCETFSSFKDMLLETLLEIESKAISSGNYSIELLNKAYKHIEPMIEDYKKDFTFPIAKINLEAYYKYFIQNNSLIEIVKLLNNDYYIFEEFNDDILPVFNILINKINAELDGKKFNELSEELIIELSTCKFNLKYEKPSLTMSASQSHLDYTILSETKSNLDTESFTFDNDEEETEIEVKNVVRESEKIETIPVNQKHQNIRENTRKFPVFLTIFSSIIFLGAIIFNVIILKSNVAISDNEILYFTLSGCLFGSIYFIVNCYLWKQFGRDSKELRKATIIESFIPAGAFLLLLIYELILPKLGHGIAEYIYVMFVITIASAFGSVSTFMYKNCQKGKWPIIICRTIRIAFFVLFLFVLIRDAFIQ